MKKLYILCKIYKSVKLNTKNSVVYIMKIIIRKYYILLVELKKERRVAEKGLFSIQADRRIEYTNQFNKFYKGKMALYEEGICGIRKNHSAVSNLDMKI